MPTPDEIAPSEPCEPVEKVEPTTPPAPVITPKARMTIAELERILQREDEQPITIMPNGEVRALTEAEKAEQPKRPLTFRENLGGEYATAAE